MKLSAEDKIWLERPFPEEEVKAAVWDCNSNKSAGPDGYSLEFFKNCWRFIKMDVISFVEDFYKDAKLTKACTSSFLALIPKINNPHSLSEYRPICLVGSLYNILSKLLSTRLKCLLGI